MSWRRSFFFGFKEKIIEVGESDSHNLRKIPLLLIKKLKEYKKHFDVLILNDGSVVLVNDILRNVFKNPIQKGAKLVEE